MPSNSPPQLDKDSLYQYAARRLGAPRRDISELLMENFDDALQSFFIWFAAKKGVKKQKLIPVIAGKNEYSLSEDVDPHCDTVLKVDFPSSRYDLTSLYTLGLFPSDGFPVGLLGGFYGAGYNATSGAVGGTYSNFVQQVQFLEMSQRINGSEPDFDQVGDTLYIFPIPASDFNSTVIGSMLITYKSNEVILDQLNARDSDLCRRYVVAFLKRDLGNIRARYGSTFMGASGQAGSDGERLLRESDAEMAQLQQEIIDSSGPMGYLIG